MVPFQTPALYSKYVEAIRGHDHRTLKPGDTIEIGSLHLTAVTSDAATIDHPLAGAGETIAECTNMQPLERNGGEENARSLGVVLTYGQARIAAFGDLTWNMEQKLVCPQDKVGPVDLFIAHPPWLEFQQQPRHAARSAAPGRHHGQWRQERRRRRDL